MLAWASSEPQALVCGGAPEGEDKEKIQVAYSLEKAEIFSVCVASDQRRWKNLGCTRPNHLSYNIENKAGPSRSFSSINQWFGVPRQSAVEYVITLIQEISKDHLLFLRVSSLEVMIMARTLFPRTFEPTLQKDVEEGLEAGARAGR